MNGYNFTERVRKVLALSREEAARLHHEYVGTEHILLGLIREGEGIACTVLEKLADPAAITETIEVTLKRGRLELPRGPDLPYTSRAKKVLEFAMAEARELNHSYVGTEHLLLGLLREEKGIAAQVLVHHGVTIPLARAETRALLSAPDAPGPLNRLPRQSTYASVPARGQINDVDPRSAYATLLRYYSALGARDMELTSELWSRSGRASRIAPEHELVSGWPEVAESYRRLFANTSRVSVEVKSLSVSPLGAFAMVVSVEEWTIERADSSARIGVDVTRVLRQEGGEWRLMHEHVSTVDPELTPAYRMLLAGG